MRRFTTYESEIWNTQFVCESVTVQFKISFISEFNQCTKRQHLFIFCFWFNRFPQNVHYHVRLSVVVVFLCYWLLLVLAVRFNNAAQNLFTGRVDVWNETNSLVWSCFVVSSCLFAFFPLYMLCTYAIYIITTIYVRTYKYTCSLCEL